MPLFAFSRHAIIRHIPLTKITNVDIKTCAFDADILVRGVHEMFANQSPLLLLKKRPSTFDGYHSRSLYSSIEQPKENVNWGEYLTAIKVQVKALRFNKLCLFS